VTTLFCCAKLVFMLLTVGLWCRAGLLKLLVVAPNGLRNVILGLESQLAWQIRYNNFCKNCKKMKVGLQWIYFYCICIFRGNIVFYAVSCLLWCLRELSNLSKNQAQRVMHCYTMIVLRYWPILTLLHSFRHEGMLLFRLLVFSRC